MELGDDIADSGTTRGVTMDEDKVEELYKRHNISDLRFLLFRQQFLARRSNTNVEPHPIVVVEQEFASNQLIQ